MGTWIDIRCENRSSKNSEGPGLAAQVLLRISVDADKAVKECTQR